MKSLRKFARIYLFLFVALILIYPLFIDDNSLQPNISQALQAASWQHFFGTDSLGRDLFQRVVLGARVSFFLGVVCAICALVFGFLVGSLAGFFGGWIDQIIMRLIEVMMSLPQLVTIGFLLLYFNKLQFSDSIWLSLSGLVMSISLASWMTFARVIRGQILREKELPYIEAARALGASPMRIVIKHIFPNILPSMIVLLGLQIPNFLLFEGFLSFIGFGVQPPTASWGGLLNEGWKTLTVYPHLLLFPAGVLFLTVLSVNILFDFFREKLLRPFGHVEHHH